MRVCSAIEAGADKLRKQLSDATPESTSALSTSSDDFIALCTRLIMSSDDGKHDVQTPAVDAAMPELGVGSSRTQDLLDADSVDAVYRAKMHVVNDAMQEIGMGRYQVRLLVLCGEGEG
jgi:hypothetical protein